MQQEQGAPEQPGLTRNCRESHCEHLFGKQALGKPGTGSLWSSGLEGGEMPNRFKINI